MMVLFKEGEVLAIGFIDDVLTVEHIRLLYGVNADVIWYVGTGRFGVR